MPDRKLCRQHKEPVSTSEEQVSGQITQHSWFLFHSGPQVTESLRELGQSHLNNSYSLTHTYTFTQVLTCQQTLIAGGCCHAWARLSPVSLNRSQQHVYTMWDWSMGGWSRPGASIIKQCITQGLNVFVFINRTIWYLAKWYTQVAGMCLCTYRPMCCRNKFKI